MTVVTTTSQPVLQSNHSQKNGGKTPLIALGAALTGLGIFSIYWFHPGGASLMAAQRAAAIKHCSNPTSVAYDPQVINGYTYDCNIVRTWN